MNFKSPLAHLVVIIFTLLFFIGNVAWSQSASQISPPDFTLEEPPAQSQNIEDSVESLPSSDVTSDSPAFDLSDDSTDTQMDSFDTQPDDGLSELDEDSVDVDEQKINTDSMTGVTANEAVMPKKPVATKSNRPGQPASNTRQPISSVRRQSPSNNKMQPKTRPRPSSSAVLPESNRRYIQHPNAEKGLIRIDKEQVYHYRVEPSEQKRATSIRLGTYQPLELVNPDDTTLTFEDLYDERNFPVLLYDQEWQFYKGFGKLGWKLGAGFYLATGHGRFADNPGGYNDGLEPEERFTLFVFPLNAGLIYRFHYFTNQWLVPYAEGGLDGFVFGEVRDDDKNPTLGAKFGGAPAAHASGGISISLGKNARSFLDLDREYGINAVYITAEFRKYFALSDRFDFSGEAITGGVTAEY